MFPVSGMTSDVDCAEHIRHRPFFYENWSVQLKQLSIQTITVELEPDRVSHLLGIIEKTIDDPYTPWAHPEAQYFGTMLEDLIEIVGHRAFVRLGSRSPKDNPAAMDRACRPIPAYGGRMGLDFLAGSERVLLDLLDAQRADYTPNILVRRWIDMRAEQEFRCFVEDGEIVGITQYYVDEGYCPWIVRNNTHIFSILRGYVEQLVIPCSGLKSLTADVILSHDFRPTLLEINPPVSWGQTYPGLFTGPSGRLDGRFMFVESSERCSDD